MAKGELAVVTGASTGIGRELAKCCAEGGYDLLICADEPLDAAAAELQGKGVRVETLVVDLGTEAGVQELVEAIGERPVDALLANAGTGLGDAFLDQDFDKAKNIVDVNVTGTLSLIHKVGRRMRERNKGKILITGSIAGYMPGSFQAVYNGSKAFIDSFSYALRNELTETNVTVTVLMPGATETPFFERAGMEDTPVGKAEKADPAKPARDGFEAMEKGEAGVVSGFMNKLQVMFAGVIPETVLAQMHRRMSKPERRAG